MTTFVAMSVKKPEYHRRYCIKIGAATAAGARKKFLEKYPQFGGVQLETMDSFVVWAFRHLSKYQLSEMIVEEMKKETKLRGGTKWFYVYPSHTSTDRRLDKDKMSTTAIHNVEFEIVRSIENGKVPHLARQALARALKRKLSTTKFIVVEVSQ